MTILSHKYLKYQKNFFAFIGVLSLLMAVFSISMAKNLYAQTLQESMVAAYQSNPEIKSARENLRAIDEGVVQALGLKRPILSLNASTTHNRLNYSDQTATNSYHSENFSLNLSQSLYDGGARHAALRAAEANILASRASLLSTEQSVMLNVAVAYLDVVRDQAVLDLRLKNVERLDRQYEAAQDRFDVGEATLTDVAQAQSRFVQAQAQRISAEGQLEISRSAFERLVGSLPRALPRDIDAVSLDFEMPKSREQAAIMAIRQNPDILAMIEADRAAKANIDRQMSGLNPDISLTGSLYETTDSNGSDVDIYGASAGVNLTIPLFQGGVAASQVRTAKAQSAKALQDLDATRRQVRESATRAWEAFKLYEATIEANESVLRANRLALEGVEQEAIVGSRTILDILDAEQDVMDIEVELVRNKRERNIASYQLAVAIGSFTPQALDLPVSYYNVNENYDDVKSLPLGIDTDYLFPKPLISR